MQKVMVFGVFDGLHEGHHHFFREAKRHGDYLVAVVPPDHIVHELKGELPHYHIGDRMERLRHMGLADEVVPGDDELSTWHVVRRHERSVVALGYDQAALFADLEAMLGSLNFDARIEVLPAHKPQEFHNRMFKKKAKTRRK